MVFSMWDDQITMILHMAPELTSFSCSQPLGSNCIQVDDLGIANSADTAMYFVVSPAQSTRCVPFGHVALVNSGLQIRLWNRTVEP